MTDANQSGDGDAKTVPFADFTKVQQDLQNATEKAQRFQGQLTDVEKRLEAFDGIDPAEYHELKRIVRDNQAKDKGVDPKDLEELVASRIGEQRASWEEKLTATTSELTAAQNKIHELTVVDGVMSKIGGDYNSDTHSFIKDIVRSRVDIDDSGNYVIKDDKGEQMYMPNQPNTPMTLTAFNEQLQEQYPSFAVNKKVSGGKQSGQQVNGQSGFNINDYLKMTPEQRKQIPAAERRKLASEALG